MKKDIFIISGFLTVILISSVTLYIDFSSLSRHSTTEEIGRITFKRKTAQRKYFEQPIWELLYKDSPVYDKDKIRTSDDSLSIIYFNNGAEIELDENTLVYLNMKDDKPYIDFTEGSIRTRKGSEESDLTIESDGSILSLNNADAQIIKDQNSALHIEVTEGSAKLTSNGQTSEILSNQSASLSSGKIEINNQVTRNEMPRPGSYLVTDNEQKIITFKWNDDSGRITGIELYNAATDKVETQQPVKDNDGSYSTSLSPGEYYWKLKKDDGTITPPKKFTILKDNPSVTVNPRSRKTFYYYSNLPSVFFSWRGSDTATSYVLEISDSRDFNSPEYKIETAEYSITVPSLSDGIWYWRIKNKYEFGGIQDQLTSQVSSFVIEKSDSINTPELYSPQNDRSVSTDFFQRNALLFNWEQNNDLDEYLFELSKNRDFSNPIINTKTRTPYFSLERTLPTGRYYWRVSYQNPINGNRETTRISSFSVSDNPDFSPVSPGKDAPLPLSENVSLSWKDSSLWGKYRVDISRNSDFSSIERSYTTGSTTIQINARQQGQWYWRVTKLPESEANSSVVSSFIIALPLDAPVILQPTDDQSIDMSNRNNLIFSWKPVPQATSYYLVLYDSSGTAVFDSETSDTSLNFRNLSLIDRGDFYIEIRAKTSGEYNRISPVSRRRFNIKLRPLQSPHLITRELYNAE